MSDDKLYELKYCPRTKHSDRPLKKACKVCWNRKEDGRCGFIPSLYQYCVVNGINIDLSMKFKCVI